MLTTNAINLMCLFCCTRNAVGRLTFYFYQRYVTSMLRRQRLSRLSSVVAALWFATISVVIPTNTAHAIACSGGPANNHLGYVHSSSQAIIGSGVDLTVGLPLICDSDFNPGTNFSTSWAMLQELGYPFGYAQSGHIRNYGISTRLFSEYNVSYSTDPYGFTRSYGASVSVGDQRFYWVFYDGSCGCLDLNAGLTTLASTPFNPYVEWSGVGGSWASETTWDTNGVPGTSSNPEIFGGMRVQPFGATSYSYNSAAVTVVDTAPSTDYLTGIYYSSFHTYHS